MKLKSLSLSDVEQVRQWRNQQIEMLRTPFLLTKEQQEQFYYDVICNRNANSRYFGIWEEGKQYKAVDMGHCIMQKDCICLNLIGMCGIENISWENRLAEISLILDTDYDMNKYGEDALKLLLYEGFFNMGLENIYTEAYFCSRYIEFWLSIHNKYNEANETIKLPNRKYYMGKYWSSYYININKGAYINENTILESTHTPD